MLVTYLGPKEIYLTGLIGLLCGLDDLETELQSEDSAELFEKGCGDYVFKCTYNEAQIGDFGAIELQEWWDIDEVAFKPCRVEDKEQEENK